MEYCELSKESLLTKLPNFVYVGDVRKGYTICNGGMKDILDKCRGLTQEQYDENVEFYPNTNEYRIIRFD